MTVRPFGMARSRLLSMVRSVQKLDISEYSTHKQNVVQPSFKSPAIRLFSDVSIDRFEAYPDNRLQFKKIL
jgi:hypothetical protein